MILKDFPAKKFMVLFFGLLLILVVVVPAGADGTSMAFPSNNMATEGLDPMDLSVDMLGVEEINLRKKAAEVV